MGPEALNIITLITVVAIEYLVIWLFIKKDAAIIIIYVFFVNAFSVPIATFLYQNILLNNIYAGLSSSLILNTLIIFLVILILIFLVESLMYSALLNIQYKKSLKITLAANILSSIICLTFFI